VPTAIWGPGIDDRAANFVSQIVPTIVVLRTNAASDNCNLGNVKNVTRLTVLAGLMRRSRKGQCWHINSPCQRYSIGPGHVRSRFEA
jgi:hypothetical protein